TNPNCPAYNNWNMKADPNCPVCLGTGFVDGYDYVEEILIRFPQTQETIEITQGGLMRMVKPRIWTMPDPQLRQFDIIINFNQPVVTQEDTKVDVSVYREPGISFEVIDSTLSTTSQITRILKISDSRNRSPDYEEGVDYVLSNNGVLWKTDNRPIDDDEYFVTYLLSGTHYRRYEINDVTPSRWRGKTLHQKLDITELDITHPAYRITQQSLTADEISTIYNPFPASEWFNRE
ncbi:hypothetical protein LCGC14_2690110, partial [marine sediment metagenome]